MGIGKLGKKMVYRTGENEGVLHIIKCIPPGQGKENFLCVAKLRTLKVIRAIHLNSSKRLFKKNRRSATHRIK